MPVKTVRIEIYSDLICPWCYIGQHRLHEGLKLLGDGFRSDIIWRPFQLNPDMPKEGMDRKTYRTLKFGSWQRSQALDSEIADTGESLGLKFNYDRVRITPNTLAGHRLLSENSPPFMPPTLPSPAQRAAPRPPRHRLRPPATRAFSPACAAPALLPCRGR